jgi:hypothetical protein
LRPRRQSIVRRTRALYLWTYGVAEELDWIGIYPCATGEARVGALRRHRLTVRAALKLPLSHNTPICAVRDVSRRKGFARHKKLEYERPAQLKPTEESAMRVMVIVKGTEDSEAGGKPPAELLADMGAFNQTLIDAGVFVDAGGLKETRKGARVAFSGKDRAVTKGPFPNISELAAGYWIWRVKDLDEAIEWAKRCPNPMPGPSVIEIREMFEMGDFT